MASQDPVIFINSTVTSIYGVFESIPGTTFAFAYLKNAYQNDPFRILLELFLVFFTIKYMLSKKYKPNDNNVALTKKEVDELVQDWQPEPLIPNQTAYDQFNLSTLPVIEDGQGAKAKVVGYSKPLMNLATSNFLNLASADRIHAKAIETLKKYGVGTCGPRGFYGTIDVHMDLERDISRFLGTEDTILYAQDYAAISSVIPAFSKRGDYIVCDDGVGFAVQKGVQISRSIVRYYKHSDMEDLERVLNEIQDEHIKLKKHLTRRFIVTEGLSANYGDIAPLGKLVELKKKFKYRLILNESQSIGVLGRRGAGLTDLYNIDAKEVDVIIGSLAGSLCSSGGFCSGSTEMIDHQRLSGLAYCYSASIPAMLAVSASEALRIMEQQPEMFDELSSRAHLLRQAFTQSKSLANLVYVEDAQEKNVPFFHIRILPGFSQRIIKEDEDIRETEERLLQQVVDECASQGVLVTRAKYVYDQEIKCPKPSIKLCATIGLSNKETDKSAQTVKAAIVKVFTRWSK